MLQALNGPSKQYKITGVTTGTAVEVKDGANPVFEDRKVVTIQPSDKIYVYFANEGETPSAATVSASGFIQVKNSIHTYEATKSQAIYILAVTGTVEVRIAERG